MRLPCGDATRPPAARSRRLFDLALRQRVEADELVARRAVRGYKHVVVAVRLQREKAVQDEIYKAVFEITKQVEVIKKQLGKLEAGTTTPEL